MGFAVAAGVVFLALAVLFVVEASRSRRRLLSERMRRTVIVERFGASSVRGVLVAEYEDGISLRHAVVLEPGPRGQVAEVPLDGDFLVYRGIVAGMQDVSATAAYAQVNPGGYGWTKPVAVPSARPSPIASRFAEAPQDPRPMAGG